VQTLCTQLQLHRLISLQVQNVVRLSVESFILFKRFFVAGLKAEEGMLSLDGSHTAYSVQHPAYTKSDNNSIKFQIRQLQYFGVVTKAYRILYEISFGLY
jgi:hypothetical protein